MDAFLRILSTRERPARLTGLKSDRKLFQDFRESFVIDSIVRMVSRRKSNLRERRRRRKSRRLEKKIKKGDRRARQSLKVGTYMRYAAKMMDEAQHREPRSAATA